MIFQEFISKYVILQKGFPVERRVTKRNGGRASGRPPFQIFGVKLDYRLKLSPGLSTCTFELVSASTRLAQAAASAAIKSHVL